MSRCRGKEVQGWAFPLDMSSQEGQEDFVMRELNSEGHGGERKLQRGPTESDPLRSGGSPSHGRADDSHLAWGQAELQRR